MSLTQILLYIILPFFNIIFFILDRTKKYKRFGYGIIIITVIAIALNTVSQRYFNKIINNLQKERTKDSSIISSLQHNIEEKDKQINLLNQQYTEIKRNFSNRSIPTKKLPELRSLLSKYRGQKIIFGCIMSDEESCSFASHLKSIFKNAGWITLQGEDSDVKYFNDREGIIIIINDKTKIRLQEAENIYKYFNSIGIKVQKTVLVNPTPSDYDVQIFVGRK